jgi:hypothetical protein
MASSRITGRAVAATALALAVPRGDALVGHQIVEAPSTALSPPPAVTFGATTTTVAAAVPGFDALAYFSAMFSTDVARQAELTALTAAGSPADAYLRYQTEFNETRDEYGAGGVDPANVYPMPDGVTVCLTADDCVDVTDLRVIDGRLTDFVVDGNEIAPRLGRAGPPIPVASGSAQIRAAYRTVSTDELSIFVEITATTPDVYELSAAVYVAPDGTQTPIDPTASMVSSDVTIKGTHTIDLQFPDADPGGTLRFLVFPADGSEPLAAVLPIEAIA